MAQAIVDESLSLPAVAKRGGEAAGLAAHIARELHDGVAGELATMLLDLERFRADQKGRQGVLKEIAQLSGTLTPNALWYEVHYGGIPAIDPSQHRLLVHGLVERPTLFTMDDLKRWKHIPGRT